MTAPAAGGRAAPAAGALGRLPLAFEPNTGQFPPDVLYVSRGARLRVALTPTEIRFTSPASGGPEPVTMRLRLAGDVRTSAPLAQDELPGRVHYFAGRDPSTWRRNVPTYRRVVYRGVYPGTDLVFHGTQREAEFDFVLAPGADPRGIRLELDGADRVALEGDDVVARAGGHELRLRKPVVYQEADTGRVPVDGRFTMGERRIGFEVGDYDRGRPLVIDPVVTYSTYLGNTGDQRGQAIGVDAAGNMYVSVSGMGIVKLSADGATLLYTTVLGDAKMVAIAVDGAGHAYVAGTWPHSRSGFTSQYPTTPNALRPTPGQPCFQGSSDGVMAKLSPDGTRLLYSSFVGGNCLYGATGIAIDAAGNFYVTGSGGTTGGFPSTRPPFGPSSGNPSPFPAGSRRWRRISRDTDTPCRSSPLRARSPSRRASPRTRPATPTSWGEPAPDSRRHPACSSPAPAEPPRPRSWPGSPPTARGWCTAPTSAAPRRRSAPSPWTPPATPISPATPAPACRPSTRSSRRSPAAPTRSWRS